MTLRIGYLVSHPIQYYGPIFRELAKRCDLTVFYAHRQTAAGQADAGFGVEFQWDVDLLSGYESRFLENVARNPSTDRFLGCSSPSIADEIERGRFDAFVVPGWALRVYMQAVRACRRLGVPVLVRGDSYLVGKRKLAVRLAKSVAYPFLLRQFDGFLYVGQANREYLLHYGAPPERMFFSPHCVDNETFEAASALARAKAPPRKPEDRRRLLFVGKLIDRKRPMDLLQAMRRLQVPAEVTFAGSGALEGALRRFAEESALSANFLGFCNQSELPAIYASADVLVLPASYETWGLVVNEAMCCGLPAVVSDAVGCAADLVDEGRTGAIFPTGDAIALGRKIGSVLALDAAEVRRNLASKMAVYSPGECAAAILEAATTIGRRSRVH